MTAAKIRRAETAAWTKTANNAEAELSAMLGLVRALKSEDANRHEIVQTLRLLSRKQTERWVRLAGAGK